MSKYVIQLRLSRTWPSVKQVHKAIRPGKVDPLFTVLKYRSAAGGGRGIKYN
jgi:hypothetical protein